MVIKALEGTVIVEPNSRLDDVKTEFLLANPEFQGIPQTGTVEAVGRDIKWLKRGDVILFDEQRPRGFKLGGRSFFRLFESQVEALING